MPETSLLISLGALIVSIAAASFSYQQFRLARARDEREQSLKLPSLDVIPTPIDSRRWKLEIRLKNRSDDRILPVRIAIPKPDGGYIHLDQTVPGSFTAATVQTNHLSPVRIQGRAIDPGETGVFIAGYEISEAFPVPPGIALHFRVDIKYLSSKERIETVSVVRVLD